LYFKSLVSASIGSLIGGTPDTSFSLQIDVPTENVQGQQLKFQSSGYPMAKHISTADPEARVWGNTVWVYCGMDANLRDYGKGPNDWSYDYMDGYHAFSSTDMINWIDHGEIFHSRNVKWGPPGWMWAPSAAWNGKTGAAAKYFLYFPHKDWSGKWRIGVATAPTPAGPFTDIGAPMEGLQGIDPTVFIDDDNKAYLYFNTAAVVRLKDNMIEIAERPRQIDYGALFHEEKFRFEEGSFMHKKGKTYYYSYSNWQNRDSTAYYATGTSPYGPFKWQGALAGKKSGSQDHHSIILFKGQWYYFYHMDTPWEEKNRIGWYGQRRITCYQKMSYSSETTIQFVTPGSMMMNSGGSLYTALDGTLYQWDHWNSSGNSGVGRANPAAVIKATADGTLYKSYRYGGTFTYDIPLANGKYRVTFKFAETYFDGVGRRIFHVALENNPVIRNLDLFAVAGMNRAFDVVRQVTVTDNELNIGFSSLVDFALICAFKVEPVPVL
jgi:arabinoxylan arabinofuranohydrolase